MVIPSTIQVSRNAEFNKGNSGTYAIRLLDEELFAAVRKARRASGDIQAMNALSSIIVIFPGAYKKPRINLQILATGLITVVANAVSSTGIKFPTKKGTDLVEGG